LVTVTAIPYTDSQTDLIKFLVTKWNPQFLLNNKHKALKLLITYPTQAVMNHNKPM